MYVNDIDIREYGGTIIYRNLSSNRVSSGVKWDYVLDRPEEYGSSVEFKDVKIDLILECDSETQFQYRLNKLAEAFRRGGEVKFKDLRYIYKMYLKTKPEYEKLTERHYRVELNLDSDYGLSGLKTASGTTSVSVSNMGNYRTPANIILVASSTLATMTINGFEHTIKLSNIPSGATVILDGLTGQIKVNGSNAIDKLTTFHLPYLPLGTSTISCSGASSINVGYYERY